ncbi:undecaprenyldiphospho-muramoylpentapeptide beta-N-acetylglucosaminyltransferase [Aureimonas mangrovi]|uniref:undecaprenyldiphospho-muramoylpentapeptide beta-N-acetylglucosaminyltransferase n=1 Tax=Aureimonas mangrovi TaxID=2758041 RepID=UPI00163DDCE1|nr:undecaprenyldiphospho-muramoylpentapeptide beta-N-acetylglucosaminyltransferase [Aureimonas mangrovi]
MTLFLLCAGGTGGHLFPAEALAHELGARGHTVHLVTDERAARYAGEFPAEETHVVPSATFGSKHPLKLMRSGLTLFSGYRKAMGLMRSLRPGAVIGFGGYPTLPPMVAAVRSGLPCIVHEQNAVMGRANKAVAGRVTAIAGGFLRRSGPFASKIVEVGNPLRPAVQALAAAPYEAPADDGSIRLLVFGGSQGARFFSDMMPEAVAALPANLRARLLVTQQVRAEDQARVEERYREMGVTANVAPFFSDLPARMAGAHLVVSRSGASTVLELSVIGRPAILVPLPHALDDDQGHNAQLLVDARAALMRRQPGITPESLAADIASLFEDRETLPAMAAGAIGVARLNATTALADLAEAVAAGRAAEIINEGTHS